MDEEMIGHWNEDAPNYGSIIADELASFRVSAWQQLFREKMPAHAETVLDIGCGPGFLSIVVATLGYRVTGIDSSPEMLKLAEKHALALGQQTKQIVWRELDVADLGEAFPPASFDVIMSRNVTWTLRDPAKTYRDCYQLLKPGGALFVFDANWHLPLFEAHLRAETKRRYQLCMERYGDAYESKTPIQTELDVRKLPLSSIQRPEWDEQALRACGFHDIEVLSDITRELWDEKEKLLYGATPLFGVFSKKETS